MNAVTKKDTYWSFESLSFGKEKKRDFSHSGAGADQQTSDVTQNNKVFLWNE